MNNSIFNDFVARFATASITSLVESFNRQVGNRGFTSARAAHDVALIRELVRRGIDVSAVYDGNGISFTKRVKLNNNKLEIAG